MGSYKKVARRYGRQAARYAGMGLRTAVMLNQARRSVQGGRKRKRLQLSQGQRKKPKYSRTLTGTATAVGSKTRPLVSNGNGMTNSLARLNYKMMKGLPQVRKSAQLDVIRTQSGSTVTGGYGRQGVFLLPYMLTSQEIYNCYKRGTQTSANLEAAAALSTFDKYRKCWLESCKHTTMMSNQCPSTIKMTIFDLICKQDGAIDPVTSWGTGLQSAAGTAPAEEVVTSWLSRPEESGRFRRQWGIIKKTNVELHSGRTHQHVFNFSYKGLLPIEKAYNNGPTSQLVVKGVTTATMIVFHGMPVDTSNDPNVTGVVTLDRTKIAWASAEYYASRISSIKGKHIEYDQNFPGDETLIAYGQNADGSGIYQSAGTTPTVTNSGVGAVYS